MECCGEMVVLVGIAKDDERGDAEIAPTTSAEMLIDGDE